VTVARIIEPPKPRHCYPWQQWTDGQCWEVEAGVDFTCSYRSMEQLIYNYAKRHRLRATTTRTEPGKRLAFQFHPIPKESS
jgi:hypothetical protein